jgi:3'-phosphoadenosine 5'-phosphosulfate (PAPS) 3'-phosphatase
MNPPAASKHAIQNWDEEMARNEAGGETQRVRQQPFRYGELADANQENVAVLRRQSQQQAVSRRSVDE